MIPSSVNTLSKRERLESALLLLKAGARWLTLKEQAQASNDVAENVERIAAMTEANTQSVRQVADAAQELETMADSLKRLVANFRT